MWTEWRPRFGWPHLCPVIWADAEGYILVMQRATQPATDAEIKAFELAWMEKHTLQLPSAEDKARDWGHLPDGQLVVCDYGYACDTEEAIQRERDELDAAVKRWKP